MAYISETREVETIVKGGLPVIARGTYNADETGADVTDIAIMWRSGKPVTRKVLDSLSASDWSDIVEAIGEA